MNGRSLSLITAVVVLIMFVVGCLVALTLASKPLSESSPVLGVITLIAAPTISALVAALVGLQNRQAIDEVAKNTDGTLTTLHQKVDTLIASDATKAQGNP